MLATSKEYHQYLKNIKWIGKLYRSLFLHPMLQKIVGKEFLDVGCGIGDFLERGNKNSLGLDTNNYNIMYLNSKGKAKGKTIEEGEKFPIEDGAFSAIICDQVIEHIDNPMRTLREIVRCSESKGTIVLGVPQKKGYQADPTHKQYYDVGRIMQLINNLGLPVTLTYYFYYPIPCKAAGNYLKVQSLYLVFTKD